MVLELMSKCGRPHFDDHKNICFVYYDGDELIAVGCYRLFMGFLKRRKIRKLAAKRVHIEDIDHRRQAIQTQLQNSDFSYSELQRLKNELIVLQREIHNI